MRYSTLGKTGLKVSALGFGCMRLPEKDEKIVRDLSTPLLKRAVELGVNYFDTAIGYCHGDSQAAVGEADLVLGVVFGAVAVGAAVGHGTGHLVQEGGVKGP